MTQLYQERLEKLKQILRMKLNEVLGNDRDEDAATFLDTSVSTFRRWKNGSQMPDTEMLIRIAEKLGISLDWFLLGKGNTNQNVETSPPLVARNKQGRYTGDILGNALKIFRNLFGVGEAEILKRSGLDPDELKALLDSAIKPDFEQMEALYEGLGVNPACFFTGDEYWAIIPNNQLLRALAAVGHAGKRPSVDLASDVFSVPDDEAEELYAEWREFTAQGKDRVLKNSWLDVLERDYSFAPEWILGTTGAMAKKRLKPESAVALEKENVRLHELLDAKNKALAAQDKALAAQDETLASIKKLLAQYEQQAHGQRGLFPPPTGDARTGVTVAPSSPEKTDRKPEKLDERPTGTRAQDSGGNHLSEDIQT